MTSSLLDYVCKDSVSKPELFSGIGDEGFNISLEGTQLNP